MLHALAAPAHHRRLREWTEATSARLPALLAEHLAEADFLWQVIRAAFLIPHTLCESLEEDLDAVDRIDDERFVAAALYTTCGTAPPRPATSPLTDPTAREHARALARTRGPNQAAFADWLLADPPAVRIWLRQLLQDCAGAFFHDAWQRVLPQLRADARHKADLAERRGLGAALAAMSPAISLDATGQRIVVDKLQDVTTAVAPGLGVTFSPTAFGRPHVIVVHSPGWHPVIQYPTQDPAAVPEPTSLELVRKRMEALAHPVRMRLARTLARGPHTTKELAAAWQLTTPEVSRHLATLKKCGLLVTQRQGRYVQHRFDLDASARLSTDFLEALLR